MIAQIADLMRETLSAKLKSRKVSCRSTITETLTSNTKCEIVYVRLLEDEKPVNLLIGQQALGHSNAIGKWLLYRSCSIYDKIIKVDIYNYAKSYFP